MRQYDMKAAPGEKTVIELKVTDQTSIRVLVIEGKKLGKTVVVTAGVHGCEYIGIEPCVSWDRNWSRKICLEG